MNYIKCKDFSLFNYHYMFVDVAEHLADQIFINHELYVNFGKELEDPKSGYRMIFCKVAKKNEEVFLQCMKELQNKMILVGKVDYINFCRNWMKKLNKVEEFR